MFTINMLKKDFKSLVRVFFIYNLTSTAGAAIYAYHYNYTIKIIPFIAIHCVLQAMGLCLMIYELYGYHKESRSRYLEIQKAKQINANITTNNKPPEENNTTPTEQYPSNIMFGIIATIVILAQMITSVIDIFISTLYFRMHKITSKHFALLSICTCFAGIFISLAYEYIGGIKDILKTELIDLQKETIDSLLQDKTTPDKTTPNTYGAFTDNGGINDSLSVQ